MCRPFKLPWVIVKTLGRILELELGWGGGSPPGAVGGAIRRLRGFLAPLTLDVLCLSCRIVLPSSI